MTTVLAEPEDIAVNAKPAGLECPRCGCCDLRVTRTVRMQSRIRRERSCRHCGRRVISYEHLAGERGC
jgi:hypothetical protein